MIFPSLLLTNQLKAFNALPKSGRFDETTGDKINLRKCITLWWGDIDFVKKTVFVNRARVQDEDREWIVKKTESFSGKRKLDAP